MSTLTNPTRHDTMPNDTMPNDTMPNDTNRRVAGSGAAHRTSGARTTLTGGLVGTTLALASTLTVYLLGNLGSPVRVVTGWAPDGADLTVAEVVVTVIVAVAGGAALLGVTQARFARAWRTWTITAALFAIASAVPLTRLDVDRGSKVALVCMHLTAGASAIAGHTIARRRAARTDRAGGRR